MNLYPFIALIPILWLLLSLGFFKIASQWATFIGLFLAGLLAFFVYDMPSLDLRDSIAEGFSFALFPIIWTIVSALFVYNITQKSKSMDVIKQMLTSISPDRRIQVLILAYAFGGFLESVAGFGTSVAIPAAMMIAIGFPPFKAAVLCLIANTVPVAFGVLGVPIITLAQVTGLSLEHLALYTSLQLFPFAVVLPFILVAVTTESVYGAKGILGATFLSGLFFAGAQTLTALFLGPELAAVIGSLFSLLALVVISGFYKRSEQFEAWMFPSSDAMDNCAQEIPKIGRAAMLKAWAPYLLILLMVSVTRFLGLGGLFIASSGSILFLSAMIGGLFQNLSLREIMSVFGFTLYQTRKTIITVLSIVAMAKVMTYSGMIDSLAVMIASLSGGMYPFIAPIIGALGTFVTGSDTSSNVLFGTLQSQTALQLNLNPEWMASAGASGATAGKMISPQSISIAGTVTGLSDQEGKMLRYTLKYCLIYVGAMGLLILATQHLIG